MLKTPLPSSFRCRRVFLYAWLLAPYAEPELDIASQKTHDHHFSHSRTWVRQVEAEPLIGGKGQAKECSGQCRLRQFSERAFLRELHALLREPGFYPVIGVRWNRIHWRLLFPTLF